MVEPVPEGLDLQTAVMPLYNFKRDQGYEVVGGKFVRKEKYNAQTIGSFSGLEDSPCPPIHATQPGVF